MVCTHNVFVVKAQIHRNLCSSYIFLPSVSFELAGEFQSDQYENIRQKGYLDVETYSF